ARIDDAERAGRTRPHEPGRAEAPARRRVFFALWPDDATRGAIERACRQAVRRSGGRPTAKRNLHLTVAFLGELEPDALELAAAVPPIGVGPFEIVLDRIGYFERSEERRVGKEEDWRVRRLVGSPLRLPTTR